MKNIVMLIWTNIDFKYCRISKNSKEFAWTLYFWHGQYLWGRRNKRKWSVKNQEKRKVWWSQFTWIWIIPQEIMLTLMTCFVGICTASTFDTNAQFWLGGEELFCFFIHLGFEFLKSRLYFNFWLKFQKSFICFGRVLLTIHLS